MIVKNKKVQIDDRKIAVSVSMNTQVHKLVADIFEMNFAKYFSKHNMSIDLNDILFISDSSTSKSIDIPASYFDEFDIINKAMGTGDDRILSIPCINAYSFASKEYLDKVLTDMNRPSLLIIGFINNIPEDIFNNIQDVFGRTKTYILGDELISSCEFGDYYHNLLTNAEYCINYGYSDYKLSIHKKINSLLNKLRDKRTQTIAITPSQSSAINKTVSDVINIDYIESKIESGYNVVVPRRMITQVNSRLRIQSGQGYEITVNIGDEFYTRYPFVTLNKDGNVVVVPALSKVVVTISNNTETVRDGRRILLRNLIVTRPDGSNLTLNNVPIDFTGYLMQFNPDDHPENYDDFEEIEETEDPVYFDPSTMSIIPHKVFTNVEQKYIPSHSLLVYIENFETDAIFNNRTLWFQEMFGVETELEVVVGTKFLEI